MLDGRLALAGGDTAGARASFVGALRSRGYFEGERMRQLLPALILAADAAQAIGDPAAALGFARDARTIATLDSLSETRSARVGEARLVEGRALLATGDTVGARASVERAGVALRAGAGPDHPRAREAGVLLATLRR